MAPRRDSLEGLAGKSLKGHAVSCPRGLLFLLSDRKNRDSGERPFLALFGPRAMSALSPLSGVKRKYRFEGRQVSLGPIVLKKSSPVLGPIF
jgi:hypothetical protein